MLWDIKRCMLPNVCPEYFRWPIWWQLWITFSQNFRKTDWVPSEASQNSHALFFSKPERLRFSLATVLIVWCFQINGVVWNGPNGTPQKVSNWFRSAVCLLRDFQFNTTFSSEFGTVIYFCEHHKQTALSVWLFQSRNFGWSRVGYCLR